MRFKRTVFESHPEGVFNATFVEWKPDTEGKYGPQTRCSFETDELMQDGRPFRISYWITESVNEKSNSQKLLRALGVGIDAMSDEALGALDLDRLIGRKCQLVIEHKKRPDGSVVAKVVNLLPLKKALSSNSPRPANARATAGGTGGTHYGDEGPADDPFAD